MQNFSPFFYKNLNRNVKSLIYRFFDEAGVAESGKTHCQPIFIPKIYRFTINNPAWESCQLFIISAKISNPACKTCSMMFEIKKPQRCTW